MSDINPFALLQVEEIAPLPDDLNCDWSLSEEEVVEKVAEKRHIEKSEESSENGFTTIARSKPKKLLQSEAVDTLPNKPVDQTMVVTSTIADNQQNKSVNHYEVCLTSLKALPKQMALARLLRSLNISTIINIKYKSPYKVFLQFEDKTQAGILLSWPKLDELEIRAQFTDQGNLSYGLIRGVDLEISEEEIIESLISPIQIISVKRLRRMDTDHKWINSETVRVCFKSPTYPTFVSAYGCRFKVDRYVFPVTQCSGCWKFGHIKKFCPTSKCWCPKCGKAHENCDTVVYSCINCKGSHMALDKLCPVFVKEKEVRNIMSEENLPYKKALDLFLKKKEHRKKAFYDREFPSLCPQTSHNKRVIERPLEVITKVIERSGSSDLEDDTTNQQQAQRAVKKKRTRKTRNNEDMEIDEHLKVSNEKHESSDSECVKDCGNKEKEKKKRKINWGVVFEKIKNIVFSEEPLEVKVVNVSKFVFEELSSFIISMFAEGEFFKRMFRHSFECS